MTLTKLVFDLGNAHIKYRLNDGNPIDIRSIYHEIQEGTEADQGTDKSPLIEYQGRLYHYGEKARNYPGKPQTIVSGDKENSVLPAIFTALPAHGLTGNIEVITFHPTPNIKTTDGSKTIKQHIIDQLVGIHVYSWNDAQLTANIEKVTVLPEGYGSYQVAKQNGLVLDNGKTLLIDIGGGTYIVRLFDEDGSMVSSGSTALKQSGVIDLAKSIASDKRSIALGMTDFNVVLEGIRNGTHRYGMAGDATWLPYFDQHRDQWFKGIFSNILTAYSDKLRDVTRFLLTGGGANILDIEGRKGFERFRKVPDSQFANLYVDGAVSVGRDNTDSEVKPAKKPRKTSKKTNEQELANNGTPKAEADAA